MGRGKEVCAVLGASWKEESHNSGRRDPRLERAGRGSPASPAGWAVGQTVNTGSGSVYFLESVFPSIGLLLCWAAQILAYFICSLAG